MKGVNYNLMASLRLPSGGAAAKLLEESVNAGRIFRHAADRLRDRCDAGGVGSTDLAVAPQAAGVATVSVELDAVTRTVPDAVGALRDAWPALVHRDVVVAGSGADTPD